jgi:urea transport system permease protein
MVIFTAVGGRMSLLGAVYGALLVNWAKTSFSEGLPQLWLFLMGGLFISVVMFFPNGLAGLLDNKGGKLMKRCKQIVARLKASKPPLEISVEPENKGATE